MKGAHSATAIRWVLLASLLGGGGALHAQEAAISSAAEALSARFPAASIKSETQALSALDEADQASARAQWAAYDREVQCQSRFFITPCVRDAQRELRAAMAQIKRVEVEANRYLRRAKDAEHEQRRQEALQEARDEEAQLAEQRLRAQADYERRQLEVARREVQAEQEQVKRAAEAAELAANRQARIVRASQPGLEADGAARAENLRAFLDKQQAAQARRAELAKRRAERAAREAAQASAQPQSGLKP